MTAEIIPLFTSESAVESAWAAYVAASKRVEQLAHSGGSFTDCIDAERERIRLHSEFVRLYKRMKTNG